MTMATLKEISEIDTMLNMYDPKYYDPFIITLKENTNINNHTESANLIIYNFGTETQKNVMKEIVKLHKKEGYLDYVVSNLEYYLLKDVINNIKSKKLARRIWGSI